MPLETNEAVNQALAHAYAALRWVDRRAHTTISSVEWSWADNRYACLLCGAQGASEIDDNVPHTPDCPFGQYLVALRAAREAVEP